MFCFCIYLQLRTVIKGFGPFAKLHLENIHCLTLSVDKGS